MTDTNMANTNTTNAEIMGHSVYYVKNITTNKDARFVLFGFESYSDGTKLRILQECMEQNAINPMYRYKIYSVLMDNPSYIFEYCAECKKMTLTQVPDSGIVSDHHSK